MYHAVDSCACPKLRLENADFSSSNGLSETMAQVHKRIRKAFTAVRKRDEVSPSEARRHKNKVDFRPDLESDVIDLRCPGCNKMFGKTLFLRDGSQKDRCDRCQSRCDSCKAKCLSCGIKQSPEQTKDNNDSPAMEENTESAEMKQLLGEFSSKTSAHGFRWTVGGNRRMWLKCIWVVAISVALVVMIRSVISMGRRYYDYPVRSVVSVDYVQSLPFPAVTICNINDLDYRKADNLPNVVDGANKLFEMYLANHGIYGNYLHRLANNSTYDDLFNVTAGDLFNVTSYTVNDTFAFCGFDNQFENCENLFEPVFTLTGPCFQFNGDASQARNTSQVGLNTGLHVIMDIQQDSYLVGSDMGAGVNVLLHPPGVFPDMLKKGKRAPPGMSTSFHIEYQETHQLAYPYTSYGEQYCLPRSVQDEGYSRDGCIAECEAARAQAVCNCSLGWLYGNTPPGVSDRPCTVRDLLSCIQYELDGHVIRKYWNYSQTGNKQCERCEYVCFQEEFKSTISEAAFPSRQAEMVLREERIIKPGKDVRSDYLEVRIFYGDMVKDTVIFEPVHTWDSVIGTVGGQMGLCLGASLLTWCEVFEFLVTGFITLIKTKMRGGDSKPADDKTRLETGEAGR